MLHRLRRRGVIRGAGVAARVVRAHSLQFATFSLAQLRMQLSRKSLRDSQMS